MLQLRRDDKLRDGWRWRKVRGAVLLMASGVVCLPLQLSSAQSIPVAEDNSVSRPVVVTLAEAIRLAELNDPAHAVSIADSGSARLDRSIGLSTLLPQASFKGQYLYTESNGSTNQAGQGVAAQPAPKFVANNAIREYAAQVLVNETLSVANFADYRRLSAVAARAAAEREIARRGLVVAVVSQYFAVVAAEQKLVVAQRAAAEAKGFVDLTAKLESGREVAHADVVKASLQSQQRERELQDAELESERARLHLGTLLFPDPRTEYRAADNDLNAPPLISQEDAEGAAARSNPDLKSALEAVNAAKDEVVASRAAYLPSLALNYTYGIDAPQFAVNGPGGVRNLGYSAAAGIDIPVWDWFATHDRVKQSQLRQKATEVALTFTQRQLVAQLAEYYSEARVADGQLVSLETSAGTAKDSLRLTKLRYSAGEATALEVVDAQNALTVTEVARADGSVRYRVALANLQTLTGAF